MKLATNKAILEKHHALRRQRNLRRVLLLFGCIFAFLLVGVFTLRLPSLQLQTVEVVGAVTVPAAEVRAIATKTLTGSYGYLIPRRSFLLYPAAELREQIMTNFLNVGRVSLTEVSPERLLITLEERSPEGVWCEQEFTLAAPRHCYYMDGAGLLYDKAPEFFGPVYFEWYGFLKQPPQLGESLLPAEDMALVTVFRQELLRLEIEPIAITIRPDTSYELMTSKGWRLYFERGGDPEPLVTHLRATLTSDVFTERLTERGNALDYIDLRFGQKVFYKFKTHDAATSTTPHE